MAEPISAWSTPIVWKHCSSLRHLQLSYCDRLTENDVSGLVKHLMVGPGETRLESLEILYCRGISEEFLLNISEEHEVEKRLRWKL
ncbi:hypothetical protein BD410DRAFT_788749 [Rickenella mellea]|uniref:F-box domain-containing protein n=1 Tax=Rickenella mellea TaxID=50990 RepID=A0A4Y7Q5I0_9AGAM|nr:hypothetical protein BD410DRAFT_788749 [Rickenella mellea]